MEYSGNTGFVYIRIGSAQRNLDDCKSATISPIPGDFEGAGDIRGALDDLKSVSLGEVKSKFSSVGTQKHWDSGILHFLSGVVFNSSPS